MKQTAPEYTGLETMEHYHMAMTVDSSEMTEKIFYQHFLTSLISIKNAVFDDETTADYAPSCGI